MIRGFLQILKDDSVKVLHSVCQQIWKTQQWPVFQTGKGTGKGQFSFQSQRKAMPEKCSNYSTVALISHTSKVMLKILQARLQQYMNCELPDVFPADILVRLLTSCCPPGGGHSHHLGFSRESFLFSPLGPSVSSMIPLFGLTPHTGSIQPLVDS